MWATFFIVGGIWFWLLSIVALILLFWEIHEDKPIVGLITIGLYLGLIHLFGDASLPSTVSASPWVLYLGLPLYFAAGVVWGLIKWALYVNRHAIEYKRTRHGFLISKSKHPCLAGIKITEDTMVPPELRSEWRGGRYTSNSRPSARANKWKIITWMCYWPLSMIWSALDEPWRYIYEALSNIFQKISDKIYRRVGYDVDTDITETLKGEDEADYPVAGGGGA
jgi:hypothetical protein